MAWGFRKVKVNRVGGTSSGEVIKQNLRQGRSRTNHHWERFAWIIGLILIIIMLIDIAYKEVSIRELQRQIEATQKATKNKQLDYQFLLQKRDFMQTDSYVEREARGYLQWLKPGDLFFDVP